MKRLEAPPFVPDIECPGEPTIYGVTNVTIEQGDSFDLMEGVYARNPDGFLLLVSVYPASVAKCTAGVQTFTYTADNDGTKTRAIRQITVKKVPNPTISGAGKMTVKVGTEINPLEGVTAIDGKGRALEVRVKGE